MLADAVEAAEGCFSEPQGAEQSYIIGPQEPITANVGTEVEFHLIGTYDDGPRQVGELALFPCESVTLDEGRVTFELPVDADGEPTFRFGVGQVDFVAG